MFKNRSGNMTPYPMEEIPHRQSPLLLPLVWLLSWCSTRRGKLKITRIGMEGLKPPYLVLSWHQGFSDYYIAPLALFPHRATYVSDVEGFAHYGKRLYRAIGCVPARRYAGDPALVRTLERVTRGNGGIAVLFPEARHSNVGVQTALPPSVSKLVKRLGLPVAVLKMHGSYLTSPAWDETHLRKVPLEAVLEKILTPEEIGTMSAREVAAELDRHFQYDEYAWQWENKIAIDAAQRAEGLHLALYRCDSCGAEEMHSWGDQLSCGRCGAFWQMDEYGRLLPCGNGRPIHIPDWYERQREAVHREIEQGAYSLRGSVDVEALPSHRGFVPMGKGLLTHDAAGFRLVMAERGEEYFFSSASLWSAHTEYDYRGRGQCLVLSRRDCCYYLYPGQNILSRFHAAKIQLAAERFHQLAAGRAKAGSQGKRN